jgi:protein TonB
MPESNSYAGPNSRLLAAGPHSHETSGGRFGNALSVSVVAHAVGGLSILLLVGRLSPSHDTVAHLLQDIPHVAWIAEGTGGSGDRTPHPARQLQSPGQDSVAIPTKSRSGEQQLERAPSPDVLDVPFVSVTAGVQELPGVSIIAPGAATQTDGPEAGGHPGFGRGPGNGPGDGFGPGTNGGLGDGYQPGNGVSIPRLIREVKPGYTSDALRARIQGTVRLQAIVSPDGSVSAARVIRSLDDRFGLDQEAVRTVKQWRFVPGMLAGRAVPVVIEIELTFTLR